MPIANCVKCGSLFSRANKPICPECVRKEEADFERAVNWLRENPGRSIHTLSEETGIELRDIFQWVREKRIELTAKSAYIACKKCGQRIPAGNFCDHCKLGLAQEVADNLEEMNRDKKRRREEEGMHYYPPERGRKKT